MRDCRIIIVLVFLLSAKISLFAQSASPWETVAPPGSFVYTDVKTAVKEAASCYRIELTGAEIFLDKKLAAKIPQLTNVMALRLVNNNLQEIPPVFLSMQGLMYLKSSGNPLTTISDSLGMLNQLRFLELYDTRFDTLPEGVYGLSRLHSLTISGNTDTLSFTKGISSLGISLTELRISNTILDTFPSQFSSLSKLNRLVLYKCKLNEIPPAVLQMNKISEVWLDSNSISVLPRSISAMSGLTYLSLRGNKIKHIPSDICFLRNLAVLDLRGNPIDPYEVQCLQALLPKCRILF